MIDLTKPIRRKSDRAQVMVSEIVSYYVEPLDDPRTYEVTRTELEDIYENIPEPRKPREWYIELYSCDPKCIYDKPQDGKTRVIEWPHDAPLPDWPEGYK